MHLINKIKAVNRVYRQLDADIEKFRVKSGIRCLTACNVCCKKPDIEVTVLECLPAAWELFRQGISADYLEKLESKPDTLCVFLSPFNGSGYCGNYSARPLICRLFGYSVRKTKLDQKSLVACRYIKERSGADLPDKILSQAPDVNNWYMKLYGIDPRLSLPFLPINKALLKALEIVIMHHQFRKKRA